MKYLHRPTILIGLYFLAGILRAEPLSQVTMDCDAGSAPACYNAAKHYSAATSQELGIDRQAISRKVALLYQRSCVL